MGDGALGAPVYTRPDLDNNMNSDLLFIPTS
jgi:hypothetical protein